MTEVTELAALDSTSDFELGIEARFPLDLSSSRPAMWDAYEASLEQAWDPEDESLWSNFDSCNYSAEAGQAGALVWSHRAWVEHSAIAESEAVLVRACLEPNPSADFKYCLSMRAVERARSTDLCHILAIRLGGYHPGPQTEQLAKLLNDELVRRVLHAQSDIDAYIGAHLVAQSTIDLRIWERSRANCDAALGSLVDLVIRDKARMLEVAWLQLEESAARRDDDDRGAIASSIGYVLFEEEGRGRQLPALLQAGADLTSLTAANEVASEGLGGVTAQDQHDIFTLATSELTDRLAALDMKIVDRSDQPR